MYRTNTCGELLWKSFMEACNKFFDARNKANAGTRNTERTNLDKKREVISQLKALLENPVENAQQALQKLTEQYNAIGHVPFKDKDALYQEYHEVLDKIYTISLKESYTWHENHVFDVKKRPFFDYIEKYLKG